MTSPPGVSTDQAVLASASPPRSVTSFSVITAALHADIGAHHRVAVAVVRYDVVGTLRQQHQFSGRDVPGHRPLVAGLELAAGIDVERDLARRNPAVADAAFEPRPAGRALRDWRARS